MKALRILAVALTAVSVLGSGAALANGESGRDGLNAAPGSAAAASTSDEVQAFFREMEQRLQRPGGAGTGSREPGAREAPQSSRDPATRADASRRGANIAGAAAGNGDLPVAPGGPTAARPGHPGTTPSCARCVGI